MLRVSYVLIYFMLSYMPQKEIRRKTLTLTANLCNFVKLVLCSDILFQSI
jgi:hypothetical protein